MMLSGGVRSQPQPLLFLVSWLALADGSESGTCNFNGLVGMHDVPKKCQSMMTYPPISTDGERAIIVYMNVILKRIESITPHEHEYKMRVQTDMYWDTGECESSVRNSAICSERYGTFHFVTVRNTKNPDAETTNAVQTSTGVFDPEYINKGCLTGDFLDVSMIFQQNFNPSLYPFEVYELYVIFDAFASADVVQLHVLDTVGSPAFQTDMPDGWQARTRLACVAGNSTRRYKARGGWDMPFSQIACRVVVSNIDDSWFLSTFVFWVVSLLANFFSGMGIFSETTSHHDILEQLHTRGTFAAGAVLAYVFIVPVRPRNLQQGGEIPACTLIFVLGLACLVVSALFSFLMKGYMGAAMRERTPNTRWYHYVTNHEDMQRAIDACESSCPSSPKEIALAPESRVSLPPSPPCTSFTATVAATHTNDEAEQEETFGSIFQGRGTRVQMLEKVRIWKRAAIVDFVVWTILHWSCLVTAFVIVFCAAMEYQNGIDSASSTPEPKIPESGP